MSSVRPSVKASVRLVVIVAVLLLVAGLSFAGTWQQVADFLARVSGYSSAVVQSAEPEPAPAVRTINGSYMAPLVGTYNIPGDYADLATAIADLNAQGVSGSVILNVVAGNTQVAPAGGYVLGGTGSLLLTTTNSTNTVTIQGNGNTVGAPTPQASGNLNDAIFKLVGADWITISGFTMLENLLNTTTTAGTNNMTEWGVALLYVTATDGANNNTITGNTIDLNRTYQNTFGIYANATHTATAVSTSATASGPTGGNSGLVITSNSIADVNMGIVVVGPTAAADNNDGITIGGSVPNANTITNFGTTGTFSGYANVSGTVNGILVRNSKNFTISNNSITSSTGGVTAGTLNGIQIPAFSNAPTGTFTNNINNNTISLQSGSATGAVNGINIPGTSATATSTLNINNNNFTQLNHSVSASAAIQGIINVGSNTAGPLTHSISNNTFTNLSTNTTGSFTFISNNWALPTNGALSANNNSIVTGFNKTGAGGTVTIYLTSTTPSSPAGSSKSEQNNNFSNITLTGATTMAGWMDVEGATGGGATKTISNNTFSNWTCGTSGVNAIQTNFSGNNTAVTSNTISNISGAGSITGISIGGSNGGTESTSLNTVHSLTTTGAAAVNGISSAGGTTSSVQNIHRNKIYNLEANNALGIVNGIAVTSGPTNNLFNNVIGDLRTPIANAAIPLAGLNISGGTTINADFNTVYLNATSIGALFGSAAINVSSTPTVTLRNNIFVNLSVPSGTGETVAYRRTTTTLTTYGAASNNNLLYAGTPSATTLIFTDLTNDDQTLSAYKSRVASRDSNSVTENPPFISTTGSNANFLHISSSIATQLESGGIPIVGITDDFDGNARNATTPDIGADEFSGILLDFNGPIVSYSILSNTASTADRELIVNVTDPSGVPTSGIGLPVIYYRKNADPYASTQCTYVSGNNYSCYIVSTAVGGVTAGDTIRYYVAAQDTAGNVSVNPSAGVGGLLSNPPQAATPPTTPSQYGISTAFSGSVNVGSGETITSLTNAGGLFEQMNSGVLTGNFVVNLTSDLTAETGAVALSQLVEEGAGGYTIQIQASGAPRTISGSNTTALINLNGADRITFSGVAQGPLGMTIRNTSATTGAVVLMTNDASSNSIVNCVIEGGNTSTSSALILFSSGTTTGNDNNSVTNSTVRDRTDAVGVPANLIASLNASTTARNSNNTISGNTLLNFGNNGIATSTGASSETWTITNNDISQTASRTSSVFGINTGGMQGASTILGNRIHGFVGAGSSLAVGILIGNPQNLTVSRNRIDDFQTTSGATGAITGIEFDGASSATPNVTIINNVIALAPTTATAQSLTGIFDFGFGGNVVTIDNNSIYIGGTASGSASSWAFRRGTAAPTTFTARNNIAYNNRTGGTGSHFAGGDQSANTGTFVSNYNFYAGTGSTAANFMDYGTSSSGTAVSFATWQTGPPVRDANSIANTASTYNPADYFVDVTTGDLHLKSTATAVINAGLTLAGVTVDFDGDTRPQGAAYEIGADEFVPPSPGTLQFSATATSLAETDGPVTLNVTRTNGSDNTVTVDYSTGGGTATAGACAPGVDYVSANGTLTFNSGETSKTFDVTICNDAVYEANQTFDVTLSNPTGGAVLGANTTSTVTINNDDSAPTVTINDISQAEGNSGATNFQTTVTVSGPSEVGASFIFQTSDGTATAPSDYTAFPASLVNIAADVNRTSATQNGFFVPVNGDTTSEPDETFFLDGSTCTDCTFADNQGVATIQNDDGVDYTVTTTGNAIVVTDNSGNGDLAEVSEPGAGQIKFAATGRTFQVDGGSVLVGDSGNLSLSGVTAITFNGQGGNDTINVGVFASALPSLTLNGGIGDDTVNVSGNITFASNANLDVDLQNDDPTPGTDNITVAGNLVLSGTGGATFKASRAIVFNTGAQVTVVDGNLTAEANQQATPTAGAFSGVLLTDALLTTNGSGDILIKGKGGTNASSGLRGVVVNASNVVLRSTSATAGAGTIKIEGAGGAGIGSNRGVDLFGLNANDLVTSVTGDISITGTGGAGTASGNMGVFISSGKVRSTGTAKINITGTGGTGASSNAGVRVFNFGGEVSSTGGDITITGFGGPSAIGTSNHGVSVSLGGIVNATGGAKITIDGTAGGGAGFSTGVIVSGFDSVVTTAFSKVSSDSGDILITGDGGPSPASGIPGANIGININSGASVVGTAAANVTINGTGGACTDAAASDCYGVDFESADVAGTTVSTQSGNLSITGTAISPNGQRQNGIRFEDSVGAQPYTITTGLGSLTLTATAGNSDPSSAAIEFADDTTMTLGGATNTFIADTISINNSQVSINAGSNALTIRQKSNGRQIDLGGADSATVLGLSDAELDLITAGMLNIGDINSGTMIVSSAISRTASTALNLTSGGDIDVQGGSLDSGGGNIVVDAFADTLATNSGVDATTGAASSFKVASGRTLRLNIGAAVVDTGYNQLNVAGQVDVTNVALSLNATATPTGGEVYTIVNNDGTDAVIGTFTGLAEGATISNFLGSGLPATISYVGGTGNDVVLTVASAPLIQFSSSTVTVGEGGSSVTLNVTRTGYTGATASVEFGTSNGTATGGPSCVAGVDFVNTSGTLNFAIGETSKTFDVTICDDAVAEASETFSATLSNATGATLGTPTTETVTITDNDGDTTLPTVSYTPLTNVATVQNRVFSVTATDNVGVTAVTVVWRNNGGGAGFLTNPCSFSSGTAQNGTWTCTILSSFGQTSPGTVSYFVSADDAASNETTSPAGANVGGGTWNMYTIGTGGTINVSIINTFENVVLGDGFTLLGNANVTGNLTLNGILNTDANKLTLGCNATVTGQNETNYVFGSIEKQFCSLQSFVFPVGGPTLPPLAPDGIPAGNYSPLTVNVTAGTVGSSLTVSVTDGFLADTDSTNSLSRFWDITETGSVTADLTFQYRPEDVNGTPASYLVLKREGGSTAWYAPGTIDPPNNRFTANAISNFSSWSAGMIAPTAANAAVEGRIRTAGGLGIRNATVVISGGGLDAPRTVQTGSFGYFRFDGLPVGETYVISVVSPRYVFANPTRLVTLDDNVIGFDFYAEP